MTNTIHKMIILGAGAAGYTAAIYAARASLNPVVITGEQPGGQLTITTEVENYPGFAEAVQGPWLMEQMRDQAINVGTEVMSDTIVDVNLAKRPFTMTGQDGQQYHAETVVIATGAQAKWLGIPGEAKFQGFGVSACATCDGFFFKNQTVAVVGGGNTAVEEALFLTHHAAKVILIHRRNTLRAEKILQDRLLNHDKVEVIWDTEVVSLHGDAGQGPLPAALTHARLRSKLDGAERDLPVDGLFVAIGHAPSTALFRDYLPMDDHGYLLREPDTSKTNIPGVFVAGDVCDPVYRQAVTAAGMGCMAALDAEKFLMGVL